MTKYKSGQTHGVPALFSFFLPGLGQLVKGHTEKAILFFIGFVSSIVLIGLLIGVVLTPIVWVWNVYDAYTSNEKD